MDIFEAKRILEDAVESLGPECHEAYAGACRQDRNDAAVEVERGRDAQEVARLWFAQESYSVPCSLCGAPSGFEDNGADWYLCAQCEGTPEAEAAGFHH